MTSHEPHDLRTDRDASERALARLTRAIERTVTRLPSTDVGPSPDPAGRARAIANAAAAKAALVSGGLALPPGPLAFFTILPDLAAIWRIQAQMVADIAGAYGQEALLTREQMLYCMFRHAASQAMRDLVVRVGGRVIVKHASNQALTRVLRKVGVRLTQQVTARATTRWMPIIGALGVGAYAYWDTGQVAKTAIALFQRNAEFERSQRSR